MGQIIRSAAQRQIEHEIPQKFLSFTLGDEVYAISAMSIKKIIEYGHITYLPMMPKFIRGILNLSGNVIPVIDLSVCFGEAGVKPDRQTCIIIVEVRFKDENEGEQVLDMGVVVDAVNTVVALLKKDISPPPRIGRQVKTQFIQGIGKIEEDFLVLLNASQILSVEDFSMLQAIKQQAPRTEEMAEVEANAELAELDEVGVV